MRDELKIEDTKIIKKYWTRDPTIRIPKLFTIHGEDDNLMALLGIFKSLFLPTPQPGSLFAVDFYKCVKDCHNPFEEVKVEVSYCANGLDLEDSCILLEYDQDVQELDSRATAAQNFESYLLKGIHDYEHGAGYEHEALLKDICAYNIF